MPIPLPNLDDRRWADLVDEGRSLIPLYSPEWTNFNASDPGITLLELFAFIAEMDIYQLNRVPDRHKRKFLELIGLKLAPPKPAHTVLAFRRESGQQPVAIPTDSTYRFGTAHLAFRTMAPLTVAPGRLEMTTIDGAVYLGFSDSLPPDASIHLYVQLSTGQKTSVTAQWEFLNQQGWWSPLTVQDSTCGFLRDGFVRITTPRKMRKLKLGKLPDQFFYVRVRTPLGTLPVVRSVSLNAIAAEQSERTGPTTIAKGTGTPSQRVTLPGAPLLEETLVVESAEAGRTQTWVAHTSLEASAPSDAHFVLDAQTGIIVFGDGRRGRVLPAGAPLTVSFVRTAATNGGALAKETAVNTGTVIVQTVVPATGAAPAETLNEGIARAVSEREPRLSAVTLADYESLAKTTPGVDLARVTALANVHPSFDGVKAFGVVTVVVVPNIPSPAPRPDRALRRRIHLNLENHRMIGTRIEVIGPTYLKVAVQTTVQGFARQDPTRIREAVVAALNRLLDPLTGGADGTGWPLGRDVYRADVLQTIAKTPGVDHVIRMELSAAGCPPQCGNICLKPTWLVLSGQHQIEVM